MKCMMTIENHDEQTAGEFEFHSGFARNAIWDNVQFLAHWIFWPGKINRNN